MIANQSQTEDDQLRLRARRRLRLIYAATLIPLVLGTIGFAIFEVIHQEAPWWVVLIMLIPVLVLVGAMLFVIRLQNRGHRWFPAPVRLLGTDRATQRRVRRSVQRGQLPTEEPGRSLGLEAAQAIDRVRWNRWVSIPVSIEFIFQAITTEHLWWRIIAITFLIVLVPVTVWNWRMYARVRTLIQTHAAETGQQINPG